MCCTDMDPTNEGNNCINQLGGVFLNGRPLPAYKRRMMIELASEGVRPSQISQILKVSSGCISKILNRYKKTGMLCPKAIGGSRPRRLTPDVISTIIQHKNASPNIFAWEIRQRLLAARAYEAEKIPSVSSINRILRKMKTDTFASNAIYAEIVNAVPGQGSEVSGTEHLAVLQSSNHHPSSTQQRNRTSFSPKQAEALEQEFHHNHYPDMLARERIAIQISVPEDTIKVWFSNRRAKLRRESQTKQNNWTSHVFFHLSEGPASLHDDKTTLSQTYHQDNRLSSSHIGRKYFQFDPSEITTFSENSTGLCWAHYQSFQPTFSFGHPQNEQTLFGSFQ
ncbi:paired box protein Pax-4 isoform X2 [Alosa alosa]|uniref:paired box protein Pax-4 isoform X2 n=1 Tax=Alosa alosa TaxID=278164 RepID=UPI0020154909|nr:paired box protein Pax-4 isoform X2 [Alosa alosa]